MSSDIKSAIVTEAAILSIFSGSAIITRLYARSKKSKSSVPFNDFAKLFLLFLFTGLCISGILGINNPGGLGVPSLRETFIGTRLERTLAIKSYSLPILVLAKILTLWFYRYTFCNKTTGDLNAVLYLLSLATIAWTAVSFLVLSFRCAQYSWIHVDQDVAGVLTYCLDMASSFGVASIIATGELLLDSLVLGVILPFSAGSFALGTIELL